MSRQWTLPLEISEFKADDYGTLAKVFGLIFPDYDRTPEEWKFEDESLDRSKFYFKRYSCKLQGAQRPAGFAQCQHVPWMYNPKKLWFDIWVDPEQQRKGVGSALYERLNRDFKDLGIVTSWTGVKEDMRLPIEFAEKRGFHEKMRAWESRLNPAAVDRSTFQKYLDKASQNGVHITTLANELMADPESYRKLHALEELVSADIPRPERFTPVSFEQWSAMVVKNPNLVPHGFMIAKHGDEYVGMSTVWKDQKHPKWLYQGLTGVLREYRGRGIAMALKLKIVEYSKNNGYEKLKTWNDSTNAPMLGINIKLGFKREVGWITFEKNLA
ncbi:MAG TPA: GNAT family N-acetyltransferase [Candidatus Bathyarchaeia archaeon]|jgi:GNAT superfamily N-acetyltransferase|nr:GNAT family N-acetyltransferase [Candidatus Bathyarchaeia archaeon]